MIILNNIFPLFMILVLGKILKHFNITSDYFLKTSDKLVYFIFYFLASCIIILRVIMEQVKPDKFLIDKNFIHAGAIISKVMGSARSKLSMLEDAGVAIAVVPWGDNHIRISYANSYENLEKAMNNMEAALKKIK